jgi:hypothetical protein
VKPFPPAHRRVLGLAVRPARRLAACLAVAAVIAACEPTAPPGFSGTVPPSVPPAATGSGATGPSSPSGGPVAGQPVVTVDGGTIRIVGVGNGQSPRFELPAGEATMTISVCASTQVAPFVTLYDADDNKLGLIVEPVYRMRNLAGGMYYVDVATNPACSWAIEVQPA